MFGIHNSINRTAILHDIAFMLGMLVLCASLGELMRPYCHPVNIAMVYLLGVIAVAASRRTVVALSMPLLSVGCFLVMIVPRQIFRAAGGTDYLMTLGVMLTVALLINVMANRIRHQEQEAKMAALAIETERLRNILLTSVSHDLRTPLTTIAGCASSLMEGKLDELTQLDMARSIYDQADRLNRLLRNLLDMTRLESGAIKLDKQWHSIEEIVGAVLAHMAVQLDERSIETSVPLDLPLILLDDVAIEQVLINLLDNASKYTPPSARIRMWAKAQHEQVTVAVDSEGVMLPAHERVQIFNKFYRGSNVASINGTGLGLTVCKGVVEAHGGKIWAEDGGGWLSFRFTLPVKAPSPNVVAEEEVVCNERA